jgi:hypothetical protein
MTEEDIAQIIDRGRRAAELLENDVLIEALTSLETDTLSRWRATHARDIDGRETLYATLQGLESFKAGLTSWVNAARLMADKVEKQQRRQADRSPFRVVR